MTIDGLNIILGFGPKVYQTPFALKLDDFVMETYQEVILHLRMNHTFKL